MPRPKLPLKALDEAEQIIYDRVRERLRQDFKNWHKNNPDKQRAYSQTWRKKFPEKSRIAQARYRKANPERSRKATLKYEYGISPEQFTEARKRQRNKCLGCQRKFGSLLKPCVDHCHRTKKFRGLLCRDCNLALGFTRDDVKVLYRLIHLLRVTKRAK